MNEETYQFFYWLNQNMEEGMIKYDDRHERWSVDDEWVTMDTVVDTYFNNPHFLKSTL